MIYAENAPYWDTTIHPAKSQAEIVELLEAFGAESIMTMQGQSRGKHAWLIRFQWLGRNYRFVFTPKECHHPEYVRSIGGKKRTMAEQARYQMGRTAVWFVKAIMTAANENQAAIFGFLELPTGQGGGIPSTTAELDIGYLAQSVPLLPDIRILPSDEEE